MTHLREGASRHCLHNAAHMQTCRYVHVHTYNGYIHEGDDEMVIRLNGNLWTEVQTCPAVNAFSLRSQQHASCEVCWIVCHKNFYKELLTCYETIFVHQWKDWRCSTFLMPVNGYFQLNQIKQLRQADRKSLCLHFPRQSFTKILLTVQIKHSQEEILLQGILFLIICFVVMADTEAENGVNLG